MWTKAVQCLVVTREIEGERRERTRKRETEGERERRRERLYIYSFLHLLQDVRPKESGD